MVGSTTEARANGAGRDGERRRELGAFLRARRAQLRPEDVGLTSDGRRRVRGLRREEVAHLASVSLSWYTWLEQERNIRMSPGALDSVSRALRLNPDEHCYVRRLAGSPIDETAVFREELAPDLLGLLDDLVPDPAVLVNGPLDVVAWNKASAAIFGDPSDIPVDQRNAVRMYFTTELRNRIGDWESAANDLVARLRNEAGKHPDDPRFAEVIDDLMASSDEFREMWGSRKVRSVAKPVGVVHHPDVGTIRTRVVQLRPAQNPGLILTVHRPADEDSRVRILRLLGDTAAERPAIP